VKITGKIRVEESFGKDTPVIPTDQGDWTTNSYTILGAIKEFKEKHKSYVGHSFTFERTGTSINTRWNFIKAK
jgi:hypothetical protein